MKFKLLISVMLAAAISTQAYAVPVGKATVIKHKEWMTNGARGTFKTGTMTLKSLKHENDDIMPVMLHAETHAANGNVGDTVSVGNNAAVYFTNRTNTTRTYYYSGSICAASDVDTNTECLHYNRVVTLEPNATYFDATSPMLDMIYNKPGNYYTQAFSYYSAFPDTGGPSEYGNSSASSNITIS